MDIYIYLQVIKGWDQGIIGSDGVPAMLTGKVNICSRGILEGLNTNFFIAYVKLLDSDIRTVEFMSN